MISLKSKLWTDTKHAYGSAENIPVLLEKIYQNPSDDGSNETDEIWSTLWSSLCHQGDVFTASALASPHLIEAGLLAKKSPVSWKLISLVTEIEKARRKDPAQFQSSNLSALEYIPYYDEGINKICLVCEQAMNFENSKELKLALKIAHQTFSATPRSQPQQLDGDTGELFD